MIEWSAPCQERTLVLYGGTAFMKQYFFEAAFLLGLAALGATSVQAGTVNGGTLLSGADADQLETWLGVGDQDFTNIWSGVAGVATAASFHAAVDAAGPTFSIYDITLGDTSSALIGGYTQLSWGAGNGYAFDPSAFIFNLTTGELQTVQHGPRSILQSSYGFAAFGNGHDIGGGNGVLGTCFGTVDALCDGYTYSVAYDQAQGQISIAGDSGSGSGDSGFHYEHIVVNSLEVYTFAPAAAQVPLPAGGVLLITALGGIAVARRKRR